jgi:hypothetical protein
VQRVQAKQGASRNIRSQIWAMAGVPEAIASVGVSEEAVGRRDHRIVCPRGQKIRRRAGYSDSFLCCNALDHKILSGQIG